MAAEQRTRLQTLIAAICDQDISKVMQMLAGDLPESLLNQADEKGFTPLTWAVRVGSLEMVELLLEGGADPNIGPHLYETPLPYSISLREHGIVTLLMKAENLDLPAMGFAAAVNAVMGGDTAGLMLLVDNGVDLSEMIPEKSDLPDAGNQATALLFVAIRYAKHRPELIKLLVDEGAELDVYSAGGSSVLGDLCNQLNEYLAALNVLLDAGAPVKQPDGTGYAPLHYAAAHDHYESCKLLLEHGADAIQTAADGTFPLLWAAANTGDKVHKFLLRDDISSERPDETRLCKLSSDWFWSPVEANWGAFTLAETDGAWIGVAWASCETELCKQLDVRYGSSRGPQPPLLIARLLRPSTRQVRPFPWRLPGEEIDIEAGQLLDLLYLAPLQAMGISMKSPDNITYKFAIATESETPDTTVSADLHPIEIVRIISYHEGFIEILQGIKCVHNGQHWSLTEKT